MVTRRKLILDIVRTMGRQRQQYDAVAGTNEEGLLHSTLIDPSLGGEDSDWEDPHMTENPVVKGVRQPTQCRDSWAAMLFYIQLLGCVIVACMYGVPAITRSSSSGENHGGRSSSAASNADDYEDYKGLVTASLIAAIGAFTLSSLSLLIMSACPTFLIQLSLLFSLLWSAIIAISCFVLLPYPGNVIGGCVGIVFFALSVCYTVVIWKRIPFASANLYTGIIAIKTNAGCILVAYSMVLLSIGYSLLWMTAVVGVYDITEGANNNGMNNTNSTQEENNLGWGYLFLLLLAYFWTEQVFQNTIHVTIAGVVSTWWFAPQDANSFCSLAIKDSFVRATTTSFGSICFGSLLVAIVETLKALVENVRQDSERDGCEAFLLCIVDCLLGCLEDMLEYFNKFAYIYVGMYGYDYLEAGKNVMTLFKNKGWTIIIADNLVSNVLSLFVLIIGVVTGCLGLIMNEIYPSWFDGFEGAAMGVAFGLSFLIGIVISAILLSIVDSSVNTVLVCFAEGPMEFEENHPELSFKMREAWREVYPGECGF